MKKRAVTAADMEFISALFERHKGIMYKTALDMGVRDQSQKNAAVHEALVRLPDKIDTLRGLGEKGRAAYMASVVRNVILNQADRRRIERRYIVDADVGALSALAAENDPEDEYIERESRRLRLESMWQALDELSDTDRRLLIEKYIDGRSDAEIARGLGVDPASVRMKLTRARRRAQRIILRKEGEGQ